MFCINEYVVLVLCNLFIRCDHQFWILIFIIRCRSFWLRSKNANTTVYFTKIPICSPLKSKNFSWKKFYVQNSRLVVYMWWTGLWLVSCPPHDVIKNDFRIFRIFFIQSNCCWLFVKTNLTHFDWLKKSWLVVRFFVKTSGEHLVDFTCKVSLSTT